MGKNNKGHNILKWATRISAVAITAFGLLFYFGYGNPLPFINPDYTIWDNIWLTIFPIMFIGLVVGLKFEKTGGYLVTIPVGLGLLMGLFMQGKLVSHMLVPFVVGVFYLIVGYKSKKN